MYIFLTIFNPRINKFINNNNKNNNNNNNNNNNVFGPLFENLVGGSTRHLPSRKLGEGVYIMTCLSKFRAIQR